MMTVYNVYIYTVASTCYWGNYGNISNVTDLVSTPHTDIKHHVISCDVYHMILGDYSVNGMLIALK